MPTYREDLHLGHKTTLVETDDLMDKGITTDKLDDAAVTTPKIDDKAITTPKLGDKAITTPKLDDASVTTPKIADENVTTPKLGDASVTSPKIADKSVSWDKLDDDLQNTIASRKEGGVALSNQLGNSEKIGITQKKLTEEITDIKGQVGSIADEEDLTVVKKAGLTKQVELKLKDKAYDPDVHSGMGRKYLRKNNVVVGGIPFMGIVENVNAAEGDEEEIIDEVFFDRVRERFVGAIVSLDPTTQAKSYTFLMQWEDYGSMAYSLYVPISSSRMYDLNGVPYKWSGSDLVVYDGADRGEKVKNVLTQAMLQDADGHNLENTIFHIQYDYTIDGESIEVPAGSILLFEGGSISNGTLTGDFTVVKAIGTEVFHNVTLPGSVESIDKEVSDLKAMDNDLSGRITEEANRAMGSETNLQQGIGALDSRLQQVEGLAELSVEGGQIGIASATDFTNRTAEGDLKIPTVGAILNGADDEPTANSNNLVKSGGVIKVINRRTLVGKDIDFVNAYFNNIIRGNRYILSFDSTDWAFERQSGAYGILNIYSVNGNGEFTTLRNVNKGVTIKKYYEFDVPLDAEYIRVQLRAINGTAVTFCINDITKDAELQFSLNTCTLANGSSGNSANVNIIRTECRPTYGMQYFYIKTDRPATEGFHYIYGYMSYKDETLIGQTPAYAGLIYYKKDVSFSNINNWIKLPNNYVAESKCISFNLSEADDNGNFHALRVNDFDGYHVQVLSASTFEEILFTNNAVIEANVESINSGLERYSIYPITIDLINDTVFGSIQPNGDIAVSENVLTTAYLRCFNGNHITINTPTFTINDTEYAVATRVIAMSDMNKTNIRMLYNGFAYVATGKPLNITFADTDNYFRLSFFFFIKGTRTQYTENIKLVIPESTVATITSAEGIYNIPTKDEVEEIVDAMPTKTDIVSLNKANSDIILPQFRKVLRNSAGSVVSIQPLILLHFSDLHGIVANLTRILDYYTHYSSYIDDVIHTGDNLTMHWGHDFEYWHNAGADNILNVIGNHDTAYYTASEGFDWYRYINKPAYDRYIAPYIAGWNAVQTTDAESEGKCYYYKDYTSKGIRLVIIDDMSAHEDTNNTQLTWFHNTLADASANNLSVIVAGHYPNEIIPLEVDCSFHKLTAKGSTETQRVQFISEVDTFISNGGRFVCWLTGHTHHDLFGTVKNTNSPQLSISVSTAAYTAQPIFDWIDRKINTKSMDLFNIIRIDTVNGWLSLYRVGSDYDSNGKHIGTLCYDYVNQKLLWNS